MSRIGKFEAFAAGFLIASAPHDSEFGIIALLAGAALLLACLIDYGRTYFR
jgi:hypothetical protein